MRSNLLTHLSGGLLILITAVIALWLGASNQLSLYVHPRYITFTMVLAAATVAIVVLGAKYSASDKSAKSKTKSSSRWSVFALLTTAICLFGALTLLLVKPATLTSATVNQRGINSASLNTADSNAQLVSSPLFASDDYSNLSIKHWAALLAQTQEVSFFAGKQANLTGFVAADEKDPSNIFYVSRFKFTCCIVDAQPLGVPVYAPGWQAKYPVDSWVQVRGPFAGNPSKANTEPVAIKPTSIIPVKKPGDPYER